MSGPLKCLAIYSRYARYVTKIHIRQFARVIPRNISDHATILNEETLTGRILLYLNNEQPSEIKNKPQETEDLLSALKRNHLSTLPKYNTDQIIGVFKLLSKTVEDQQEFKRLMNILDRECCARLISLDNETILKLLQCYMNNISNRIVEYDYYNLAINKLYNSIGNLSRNDLLQLIFYIGLLKKSYKAQGMLRRCLQELNANFIHSLSKEELCVICNSTFKTSTKISNRLFLDKVRSYINDNLSLLKDPALFTTLVKTLRHNRHQNDDLLETISCTIFFNKTLDCYSFAAQCHILALFSDYLYINENLYSVFTEKCVEQLKEKPSQNLHTYLVDQPRAKDIKRLLWALSNVNYRKCLETTDIKNVIVPKLIERIKLNEFQNDPGSLVEIILYLWMLHYRAVELVPYAFTKENLMLIKSTKSQAKHKLNLLLTCIYFEDRPLYKQLNLHPDGRNDYKIHMQYNKRPVLERIYENLKPMVEKLGFSHFDIGCAVPYLNVVGIIGYWKNKDKAVYLEVLDDFTYVKNVEKLPSGMMQLKLRILNGFEEGVVVIDSEEIAELTEFELQQYLLGEIELVC